MLWICLDVKTMFHPLHQRVCMSSQAKSQVDVAKVFRGLRVLSEPDDSWLAQLFRGTCLLRMVESTGFPLHLTVACLQNYEYPRPGFDDGVFEIQFQLI